MVVCRYVAMGRAGTASLYVIDIDTGYLDTGIVTDGRMQ